jgi:PKD repeat protein
MRSTIVLLLLFLSFSASAQVGESLCIWKDGNNQFHNARVNPATGVITPLNTITGMTAIVMANSSVFKPTTGEYMSLAVFSSTFVWLRVDVSTGSILGSNPVTENWTGVRYHCKNDTIYALRKTGTIFDLIWIDPVNATSNTIATIPGITGAVVSSFSIDPVADTYTFTGASGSGFQIVTLDLLTGAVLSQNPFPNSVPGQYFNCLSNKIYGLYTDPQNQSYYLAEVQPSQGTVVPTYLLSGNNPGNISGSVTFNAARNQFTYIGFDAGNNPRIFAIDGASGTITASAPMTEIIVGLEDSICCDCPLPVARFDMQNNASSTHLFNHSTGSPNQMVWDFGDGHTSSSHSPVHAYLQEGTYQVCLTVTNNCGSSSVCDSIEVFTVSAEEADWASIAVYPNPADDRIQVNLPVAAGQVFEVEIHNLAGKTLFKRTSEASFSVETAALPDGIYFLNVNGEGWQATRKVVVQH